MKSMKNLLVVLFLTMVMVALSGCLQTAQAQSGVEARTADTSALVGQPGALGVIGLVGLSTQVSCADEGFTGMKLEWCRNICEKGYTGNQLDLWIRRWVDRYRQLPQCALNE